MLVLATLLRGPLHGYGIAEVLKTRSDGKLDVPEGSLYPALHRLESQGSVASDWERRDGRRRRVYTLTEHGLSHFEREQRAWSRFADSVGSVLASPRAEAAALQPTLAGGV